MLSQLLQISTVPIKYEMQIERARLEVQQNFIPQAVVEQTPARIDARTRDIQVQIDNYPVRASLGMKNNLDLAKDAAQKGEKNISDLTMDYVQTGKQLSQIQDGVTIGQIVRQKTLEQPEMYTAFLPSGKADISWIPQECQMSYTPGELNYDFKELRNAMNYIPGSVKLNILQYPDVQIKYIGEPNYVPPSANPNYEQIAG